MSDVVVVYYSLEGNTRYVAEKIAGLLEVDLVELKPKKDYPRKGFMKYFHGGKDVTTNAKPKLLPYHVNWNECEKVVIATPIWARSYAAPINTFLQDNQEELRKKEISVYVGYRGNTGNTIETIKENLQIDKLKSVLKLVDPLAKPSKEKEEEIMRFVQEIQK